MKNPNACYMHVARRIRLFLVLPVPFWEFDFGIPIVLSLVLHFSPLSSVLHTFSRNHCINISFLLQAIHSLLYDLMSDGLFIAL